MNCDWIEVGEECPNCGSRNTIARAEWERDDFSPSNDRLIADWRECRDCHCQWDYVQNNDPPEY